MEKKREYILGLIRAQRTAIRRFIPCRCDILCRAIILHAVAQSLQTQERVQIYKLLKEFLLELFFCLSLICFMYTLSVIYIYSRDSTSRIREIYADNMPMYFIFYGLALLAVLTMLYLFYCKDWYSREKLEHLHFLDELEYMVKNMSNGKSSHLIDNIKAKSVWLSLILRIKLD